MSDVEEVRQSLRRLGWRLASGEVDEESYDQLRDRLLAGLSPAERIDFGPGAPSAFAASPSASGVRLGPSGGAGGGLTTNVEPVSEADLKPGAVLFDQWRIERKVGRGKYGLVLEAEDLVLRERQTLKVLDPVLVARPEMLERFRRGVRERRWVVHPRIVRIFDYREDLAEGLALFSMEHVVGTSLQGLLSTARERGAPVPVRLALSVLEQLLEALDAAHGLGFVHRDVTPANVLLGGLTTEALLSNEGCPHVKLADFGIAGAIDGADASQRIRISRATAGVAPELQGADAKATAATDVYGAGAILYELLTGESPVGRFEDPSRMRPETAGELEALVLWLLHRDPAERPSVGEAAGRVKALAREPRPFVAPASPNDTIVIRTSAVRKRLAELQKEDASKQGGNRGQESSRESDGNGVKEIAPGHPWYPRVLHPAQRAEAARLGVPLAVEERVSGIVLVLVPGGAFDMGRGPSDPEASEDESPRHRVELSPFYMGVCPVLQEQWERVAGAVPGSRKGRTLPVETVSANDAAAFLARVNAGRTGLPLRLPTEAEWERAARGGTATNYWWGDRFRVGSANCRSGGPGGTTEAGLYPPNPFGLLDILGNVWEWCSDWYDEGLYVRSPVRNPTGPPSGRGRVLRGGAWFNDPKGLRVSNRSWRDPEARADLYGLRCVLDVPTGAGRGEGR